MGDKRIQINRAPVLTLWASVVAERLGFSRDESLSLGKAVAGLTAQIKGRRLGISPPVPKQLKEARARKRGEEFWVDLCGRAVPAVNTDAGVRAVTKGQAVKPEAVERYLAGKFGDSLAAAAEAMGRLAQALKPGELADRAFSLYEQFRPAIPAGVQGWGAKGILDLDRIRDLAGKQ